MSMKMMMKSSSYLNEYCFHDRYWSLNCHSDQTTIHLARNGRYDEVVEFVAMVKKLDSDDYEDDVWADRAMEYDDDVNSFAVPSSSNDWRQRWSDDEHVGENLLVMLVIQVMVFPMVPYKDGQEMNEDDGDAVEADDDVADDGAKD